MHKEAMERWPTLLKKWNGPAKVLDVGSYDVNGCLRPLLTKTFGWDYTGIDISPGPNVDIVCEDPYRFPFPSNTFDVVVSSSTMEHVQAIWLWVPELVRVLKPAGMLAILTHTNWPYHPHPIDTWRIMPDGMKYLFDLTGQLERYQIDMYNATDINGVAWKVPE